MCDKCSGKLGAGRGVGGWGEQRSRNICQRDGIWAERREGGYSAEGR